MPKKYTPNMFISAPFVWPQGTFNPSGQSCGNAKVTQSQEILWTVNSLADESFSVQSNSGHNVTIHHEHESFDHQKSAFTLSNTSAGILILGDNARRITVTNAPSINGGRTFVAELSEDENFGRICTPKRTTESEMTSLIQLAKKAAELSKKSVAIHTSSKPYYYLLNEITFSFNREFFGRDKNSSMVAVLSLDDILAIEVF